MAAGAEVVRDGAERREELLGVLRGFEALEHALSSSRRAVRVLRPIIEAFVPPVLDPWKHAPQGGWVTRQFVRDDDPRLIFLPLDHAAQEGLGRLLVAS